jgi:hypothetical protein
MNKDVVSFDNVLVSILTVFVCISLEGWTDTMYVGRDVTDTLYINDIYFLLMIIIGAFVVVNLILAVLFTNFHDNFVSLKKDKQDNYIIKTDNIQKE